MKSMKIAAVYLARGDSDAVFWPRDLARIQTFCNAYGRHDAGVPHDLVVVRKGLLSDPSFMPTAQTSLNAVARLSLSLPDEGFDLGSYREAALVTSYDLLCFLNSSSRPLHPGWLRSLAEPFLHRDVGITGASCSFEVNPHFRTNAFCIRPSLYLELLQRSPYNRNECWAIEHGFDNLTQAILRQGLRAVLALAGGHHDFPSAKSATDFSSLGGFRSGEQEKLLVADNQTDHYAHGDADRRRYLSDLAWGGQPET